MNDEFDDLIPMEKKKSRHQELLSQLKEIEANNDVTESESSNGKDDGFLPSSYLDNAKKSKKKKQQEEDDESADDWFASLMEIQPKKIKARNKALDLFGEGGKKKKKKKKNGEEQGPIDFSKEFAIEEALLKNLLQDQNKFTESLQRQYDGIASNKGTARGLTKTSTELMSNINQARSLSASLVKDRIALKKSIVELGWKDKKENGLNLDSTNVSDATAQYLKQLITQRSELMRIDNPDIEDFVDDEDMFEDIRSEIGDTTARSEEAQRYLEYENKNVEILCRINEEDEDDYEFIAVAGDGTLLDDYPLPAKESAGLTVNRSTGKAIDVYGKAYKIEWF